MKTTVDIADDLFNDAKLFSVQHGCTLREVIESGLRIVLQRSAAQKTPFRLRKHTFKGRGLAQPLDWRSIREKIYEGRGE